MSEVPPDNLAIYDAGWQSWLDMKRHGPASRWLRSLIADMYSYIQPAPLSILDVGCGEGTTTLMLASGYPQASVLGVDFSASGIAAAQRHLRQPNLRFFHDSQSSTLDRPSDLVCCFEVLEHVDDWQTFLARLAGAAGRHLLVSFPTGRMRPFEVNVGHLRNFAPGEVEAELSKAGFRPVRTAYAGFPFYSPLYREFCQLTDAGNSQLTRGNYGIVRKSISASLFWLFRYASTRQRRGDQFVGLFERVDRRE